MRRREVLTGLAAMAISPWLVSCAREEEVVSGRTLGSIGIQLYTVRDQMAVDVRATLTALAEMGYKEIEFAGYFDHSPADIRAMLDDLGLSSPSAHAPIEMLRDAPETVIETWLEIGHEYVVMPWLTPEQRDTLDKYRAHAELFNTFAEKCTAAGLKFAYHNHEFEFEAIDGTLPMDLLLAEVDPSLMQVELDFYWTAFAGADPFEYFERYPGRFPLCHVKDMAADKSMADVGAGTIDFAALFAAREQAGFEHFFVERDDAVDTLASAANSFAGISAIEF